MLNYKKNKKEIKIKDNKILELVKECRNSSFNKYNYQVNLNWKNIVQSMLLHTYYDCKNEDVSSKEWLERVVPEFQRSNNKWSKQMKTKFIENLLKGVKTEILLFRMKEQEDAQIIDGLQRTTAILDFLNGKIKPFGYSYSDLKEDIRKFPDHNALIKIYTFDTWEEVGKFYIDMNENITHSKADIQKPIFCFLKVHNIQL